MTRESWNRVITRCSSPILTAVLALGRAGCGASPELLQQRKDEAACKSAEREHEPTRASLAVEYGEIEFAGFARGSLTWQVQRYFQ